MLLTYCLNFTNNFQELNIKKTEANCLICIIQLLKVLMNSLPLFSFKIIFYDLLLNKNKKSFIQ